MRRQLLLCVLFQMLKLRPTLELVCTSWHVASSMYAFMMVGLHDSINFQIQSKLSTSLPLQCALGDEQYVERDS